MKIIITGVAGFIGSRVAEMLLERGEEIVGIDNLNDYYDVSLKRDRLSRFQNQVNFDFRKLDLGEKSGMEELFAEVSPDRVIHLGAQAGVRYSLQNPHAYIDANVVGMTNVLEGCRRSNVDHLVYASSSSVYGANTTMPFSVHDNVDHPLSLYAATKKANELLAHSYSHIYGLAVTGLRFFTVYGPWGRPDMSLFLFTKKILAREPIEVFNYGNHLRDFTYIDDIVGGVIACLDKIPIPNPAWTGDNPDPGTSKAPYRLYNIGNNSPVQLMDFISILEDCLGIKAEKKMLPLQAGDVPATYADVTTLVEEVGYRPTTPIEQGIRNFVDWYKDYYKI